jgi:ribosomal protein S18 acetylase RimI-like enzyme
MGDISHTTRAASAREQVAVALRPTVKTDEAFALVLYMSGAVLHLSALGPVDENKLAARFKRNYRPDGARIIHINGADIGWLQVLDAEDRIHIEQLHLIGSYRNRGIGTRLIKAIMKRARDSGVPVELNVIRGNPAFRLYERLGFQLIAEEPEKLRMRWEASAGPAA